MEKADTKTVADGICVMLGQGFLRGSGLFEEQFTSTESEL